MEAFYMKSNKLNILVLDDESDIINVYKIILDPTKYNYTVVRYPEEALELYKFSLNMPVDKFNVVITDTKMSIIPVIEIMAKIKELDNTARIIIISTYSDLIIKRMLRKYKFHAFLTKPYKLSELYSILKKINRELYNREEIIEF
jgi:DNA-binding NtrC family response regulator